MDAERCRGFNAKSIILRTSFIITSSSLTDIAPEADECSAVEVVVVVVRGFIALRSI